MRFPDNRTVETELIVPVLTLKDALDCVQTVLYLNRQRPYMQSGRVITDNNEIQDSPIWEMLPDRHRHLYTFEGPMSAMIREGMPKTEKFLLVAPGAVLPQDFIKEAHDSMDRDPGLAFYGHAFGENNSMGASKIRSALREEESIIPQALVIRRTIFEQMDFLKGNTFGEVSQGIVSEMCKHFRCHIVVSREGPKITGPSSPCKDMPDSTPFEELLADCCEYFNASPAELSQIARKDNVDENASIFQEQMGGIDIDSGTEEAKRAIGKYYEGNDAYINELVYWHCFRYWDGWWTFSRFIKGKFLEYGGGLGTMSAFALRQTADVNYFDINKKMIDFVNFRKKKRSMPLRILPVEGAPNYHLSVKDEYDTICAIDVIEHIPNWEETTSHLLDKLNPGGFFIQHTNFGRTHTHPMHFNSSISMGDFLKSRGMNPVIKKYREFKDIVWEKPS